MTRSRSSTTAALIPELGRKPGLVVMTNSLNVANALRELEHEPVLLMTGGTWDPHSESFQGQVAEQVLRSYDFDQLFIGADGIDLEVFVKKDDAEGTDFFYLGQAAPREAEQTQMPGGSGKMLDVVTMKLDLEAPLDDSLYEYFLRPTSPDASM